MTDSILSIPSNTFEYNISDNFLNENINTYNSTNLTTKNFNNVYELSNIAVSINVTESAENAGHYILKFKAEDIVFKSKLTVNSDESSNNVYLEKMLPEDADISDPQPTVESVRDSVPDDLKLTYIQSVAPKEPEFQFYTDRNYSKLYIKVFSNRGSGVSDGWLSFNNDNKFIVIDNFTNDDLTSMNLYQYFNFILPSFIAYQLDDLYNGLPLTTELNSTQFYYTNDALANGPKNINLGGIKLIIQGYDLYSSNNNSINTPTENNDKYELLFSGTEGDYTRFCLEFVDTATDNYIYFTDGSYDTSKKSVICKLFKDILHNGIYAYILLSDSGINTDSELLKNKVWLGIGDDGKLQLVENINSSINLLNYFTNTAVTTTTEGFTNSTRKSNFMNNEGYKIINTPNSSSNEPSQVAASTPESCAAYCYGNGTTTNIGAYFNGNTDSTNDTGINCKCYSKVNMTETGNALEETILFGTMAMNHRNSSNVTRTLTVDSATQCLSSCLVDDTGVDSNENKAYTFDGNTNTDNCTCHVSTEITYNDADGKVTGPTQTYVEQSDYIPLVKYFETSALFNYFKTPGMRTLLIIFKIISVSVALILYSYYSHYDMPVFQFIKVILIAIFSELYLIYGFVKLVLTSYKKGVHEV
jgi:hypothetical protein